MCCFADNNHSHHMDTVAAVRYALLAYCTEDQLHASASGSAALQAALQEVKCVQFFSDNASDAQAYLLQQQTQPVLVAAIRGTNSLKDAFYDMDAFQVSLPMQMQDADRAKARVHCGFVRQYNGLVNRIVPSIDAFMQADASAKLVCTGHSSGAGIACLLALKCAVAYPGRVVFRGFGSPMVGNSAFCRLVKKHVSDAQLFKLGADPITKVPIGAAYTAIVQPQCYGRPDACPKLPSLIDMPDHIIERYVQAIEQQKKARALNPLEAFVSFTTSMFVKAITL